MAAAILRRGRRVSGDSGLSAFAVASVSHIFVAVNMAPFMTSGATMERKAAL